MLFLILPYFFLAILAAPVTTPQDRVEHVVFLNITHPSNPSIARILASISLSESHKHVVHVYNNTAFAGFAAHIDSESLLLLSNTTGITHVEPVALMRTALSIQSLNNSPWGLQRLSTSSPSINGDTSNLNFTYTYDSPLLGANADVYIIDTGIFTPHVVFNGRATMGWSFDGNDADDDGHGTHVAGIAAGLRVGVAQAANIIGVRVLGRNGGGSSSDVVKGIDWAMNQHCARSSSIKGSVFALSLESSAPISVITTALSAASKAGIHVIAAAGNNASDACLSSPANLGGTQGPAIAVGSVGPRPANISSFSNTGPCVDVYAAGEDVVSSWPPLSLFANSSSSSSSEKVYSNANDDDDNDDDEIKSLEGTSMAAPHVAGLVACAIAANATLAADPLLMKEWVASVALKGIIESDGTDSGVVVVDGDSGLLASNGVSRLEEQEQEQEQEAERGEMLGDKEGFISGG